MPKDKYKKQSYTDKMILAGLKLGKEVKAGAKKQFKKDVAAIKGKLKRKKKKAPASETVRTKAVKSGLEKSLSKSEVARLRRKKK